MEILQDRQLKKHWSTENARILQIIVFLIDLHAVFCCR